MSKVQVIVEAGVNHNGSVERAKLLCQKAKEIGADCIKFQTFKTEAIVTADAALTEDQKRVPSLSGISQFKMLKDLELSYQEFEEVKEYCDGLELEFLSTPDEVESLEFLIRLGVRTLKVGSGEVNNLPFLRRIGSSGKEVILSTGMSTLEEVRKATDTLIQAGLLQEQLTVLHCTSAYPAPIEQVNLRAMQTLRDSLGFKVGYSDHTLGIEVSLAAVALGAQVIEKHFTLDRSLPGPDHAASIEPEEMKRLIEGIRKVEQALGSPLKAPTRAELNTKEQVRKSLVALCDIKESETLTEKNVGLKRPGNGLGPELFEQLIGTKAKRNFKKDELITR